MGSAQLNDASSGGPPPPPLLVVNDDALSEFRVSIVDMAKIVAFQAYYISVNITRGGPDGLLGLEIMPVWSHDVESIEPYYTSGRTVSFAGFVSLPMQTVKKHLIRESFQGIHSLGAMPAMFYGTGVKAQITSNPVLFARACCAAHLFPFDGCRLGVAKPPVLHVLDPSQTTSFEDAIDKFQVATAPRYFKSMQDLRKKTSSDRYLQWLRSGASSFDVQEARAVLDGYFAQVGWNVNELFDTLEPTVAIYFEVDAMRLSRGRAVVFFDCVLKDPKTHHDYIKEFDCILDHDTWTGGRVPNVPKPYQFVWNPDPSFKEVGSHERWSWHGTTIGHLDPIVRDTELRLPIDDAIGAGIFLCKPDEPFLGSNSVLASYLYWQHMRDGWIFVCAVPAAHCDVDHTGRGPINLARKKKNLPARDKQYWLPTSLSLAPIRVVRFGVSRMEYIDDWCDGHYFNIKPFLVSMPAEVTTVGDVSGARSSVDGAAPSDVMSSAGESVLLNQDMLDSSIAAVRFAFGEDSSGAPELRNQLRTTASKIPPRSEFKDDRIFQEGGWYMQPAEPISVGFPTRSEIKQVLKDLPGAEKERSPLGGERSSYVTTMTSGETNIDNLLSVVDGVCNLGACLHRADRVYAFEKESNTVARVDPRPALMSELHDNPFGIYFATTHDVILDGHIMFMHVETGFNKMHANYQAEWGDVQHYSFLTEYDKAVELVNLCWSKDIEFRVLIAGASLAPIPADSCNNPFLENALAVSYGNMSWGDAEIFTFRPWTLFLFRALDFMVHLDPSTMIVFLDVTGTLFWCSNREFLMAWILVLTPDDIRRFIHAPCGSMISIFQNWTTRLQDEWTRRDVRDIAPLILDSAQAIAEDDVVRERSAVEAATPNVPLPPSIVENADDLKKSIMDLQQPMVGVPAAVGRFYKAINGPAFAAIEARASRRGCN